MIKLKINRYDQKSGHCAICAAASAANYYNKDINYFIAKKKAKKIFKNINEGLYSGEIGLLLNELGFKKVDIISSNMDYLDYSWSKLSKKKLIKKLNKKIKHLNRHKKFNYNYIGEAKTLKKWLKQKKYNNKLIIDYNFGDYIRNFLNKKKPLLISFSWTIFFKEIKSTIQNKKNDITGDEESHAVLINGFTKNKVFIIDSNDDIYKNGLYTMTWENLMTALQMGDVYLPYDYK